MINSFLSIAKTAFGVGQGNFIPFVHMCLRGVAIYLLSILLLRFNRRFAGIRTPFNFILFVTLGSISAGAITGEIHFISVCGVIIFLITFNRVIAGLVYYIPTFENLLKGHVVLLAAKGEIQWTNMRRNYITKRDLYTELRDQMKTDDLESVDYAFLATDGEINFVKRTKECAYEKIIANQAHEDDKKLKKNEA